MALLARRSLTQGWYAYARPGINQRIVFVLLIAELANICITSGIPKVLRLNIVANQVISCIFLCLPQIRQQNRPALHMESSKSRHPCGFQQVEELSDGIPVQIASPTHLNDRCRSDLRQLRAVWLEGD